MSIFDQSFNGSIIVLSEDEGQKGQTKAKTGKPKKTKNQNMGKKDIFDSDWLNL